MASAILRSWLGQTGLRQTNFPLYQILNQLINNSIASEADIAVVTGGNSGGGLVNATYLTSTNQVPLLPNSKELTAGAGILFTDSLGEREISALTGSYTDFIQDLGIARSGHFTLSGLSGLTTGANVSIIQTRQPIPTKGNAQDEFEMNAIVLTGETTSATTIEVSWFSCNGDIVVGDYAFAYSVSL